MIRRIISVVLLIAIILTLAACGGNRYYDLKTVASVDVEEGLKEFEDNRRALASLGIDIDDPESSFGSKPEPEPEPIDNRDKPGRSPYKGKYTAVTWDVISDMDKELGVKGKYYNTPAYVLSFWESDDGTQQMLLSVEFGYITVMKGEVNEGWRDIKVEDSINIYFRFIGNINYFDIGEPPQMDEHFMKYFGMVDMTPCGSYEYFEPYES